VHRYNFDIPATLRLRELIAEYGRMRGLEGMTAQQRGQRLNGRRVLFNFFDGPGEWAGAAVCDDTGVAARHAAALAEAWETRRAARGLPAELNASPGYGEPASRDATVVLQRPAGPADPGRPAP
jgi:hypothetical protein